MIAINKMNPGENAARVGFHFSPPLPGDLVPKMAKSGQYMPHKSQPLHFSG